MEILFTNTGNFLFQSTLGMSKQSTKITRSSCSFHGHLITCKKMNFIFETVFEILEFIKFCNLTGLEHFYFQLQNQTCDFHRFTTTVHHLNQKKHIDGPMFFQNSYCWFLSEHFGHVWLNPTNISWSNCCFPECLTTCKNWMQELNLSVIPAICYFRWLWV